MDKLILALGPAFAAGFAVQRLLEILDPALEQVTFIKANKKVILGIVSLIVGFALSFGVGLRVLQPLGVSNAGDFLDACATGLIVSAGADGFNSIVKFLGYAKEDTKAASASKMAEVEKTAPSALEKIQKMV